jgi:hypothetical protein
MIETIRTQIEKLEQRIDTLEKWKPDNERDKTSRDAKLGILREWKWFLQGLKPTH